MSIAATVKDPVCGMDVVPGIARSWDYLFETIVYHFCGSQCRSRFQANPKGFLSAGPGQPVASMAAKFPISKGANAWVGVQKWLASVRAKFN